MTNETLKASRSKTDRLTMGDLSVKVGPSQKFQGMFAVIVSYPAGMQDWPDLFRFQSRDAALEKFNSIVSRYNLVRA